MLDRKFSASKSPTFHILTVRGQAFGLPSNAKACPTFGVPNAFLRTNSLQSLLQRRQALALCTVIMIEFKTYNRIVKGDLRPFLDSFEERDGINLLKKEFFSFEFIVKEEGLEISKPSPFISLLKEGDSIVLEIDEETNAGKLIWPDSPENELINLDIRPSVDEKSEIFTDLITMEYLRIKKSMSKFLEEASNESELKFYVNKNYQYGIELGKELHSVYKAIKCKTSNFFSESNELILDTLKKYIVYSLLFIQETFNSFLEAELLTQYQLEDLIFEGERTNLMLRVNGMNKCFEKIFKNKIKKECKESNSFVEVVNCYKSKLLDIDSKIQEDIKKNGCTTKHLLDNKKTIENLLKEYLYIERKKKIENETINKTDSDKYKYMLDLLCDLKLSKMEDSEFIIKTPIVEEITLQLDHLEKTMQLGNRLKDKNIQSDLINCLITLQGRKQHLNCENRKNELLTDLLRAMNYYVSDETRSGSSGSNQATESGEIDIAIRNYERNGIIDTIIEAFEINSVGEKNKVIGNHINKLINRYDSSGNSENYIIVYSNLIDFSSAWNKFKDHVKKLVFNNEISFQDFKEKESGKHKLYTGSHNIPKSEMKITYLFLDTHNNS